VFGAVSPAGQAVTYFAQYGLESSTWCQSGTGPAETAPVALGAQDTASHAVSVALTGLSAGDEYCAAIAATAGAATVTSTPLTFVAGAPTAVTDAALAASTTAATVLGELDPAGQATTYVADYAPADSAWCMSAGASGGPTGATTPVTLGATGTRFDPVYVEIASLTPGDSYCAELVATAGGQTSPATAPVDVTIPSSAPAPTTYVETDAPSVTGAGAATLTGAIDSQASSVGYDFAYGPAAGQWCSSGGASGAPAASTPLQTATGDEQNVVVSADVSGLTAGEPECDELIVDAGGAVDDGFTASFTAGAPSVAIEQAAVTAAGSATVDGVVNPAGQATSVSVSYAPSDSTWCTTAGAAGSAQGSTGAQPLETVDSIGHFVTLTLTGLSPGVSYCAAMIASNASATAASAPAQVRGEAPEIQSTSAHSTGPTTAEVDGTIDPDGQATNYQAVYDVATSTWCANGGQAGTPAFATAPASLGASDLGSYPVTVGLTGLSQDTAYCAALVASYPSDGTRAAGATQTFTAGVPAAQTTAATVTGEQTATVSGAVDPAGVTGVQYEAQYAPQSSPWCQSGGDLGSPSTSASAPLGQSDPVDAAVSVAIGGLSAGTPYCVAIAIAGAAGLPGDQIPFTAGTPPPSAVTSQADATSPTTAEVDGTVDPFGQTTTYDAAYGPADSTWCQDSGLAGAPADTTATVTLASTADAPQPVSVGLAGLTAGADDCVAIEAASAAGGSIPSPVAFTAAGPTVDATSAAGAGPSAGVIDATVDPAGQPTTFLTQYGPASSSWCAEGTGPPPQTTASTALGFTDGDPHAITAQLSGLTVGSWCAAIQAANADATTVSGRLTFTVSGTGSELATTVAAFATAATTAEVDGTVDPNGQPTTYVAQYAPASSAWCENGGGEGTPSGASPAVALTSTASVPTTVTADLSGLTPGAEYCAAIAATNATGSAASAPLPLRAGAATATTADADPTGPSTAEIDGEVGGAGQPATYEVLYGPAGSLWCQNGGVLGSPPSSTAAAAAATAGTAPQAVFVALAGLTPGVSYCAAVAAANASGAAAVAPQIFTAGAPSAVTQDAYATGPAAAAVDGLVDPSGQATSYEVGYGLESSTWCQTGAGAPASVTAPVALPAADTTFHEVTPALGALTPGDSYCAALIAGGGDGTSTGAQVDFVAGAPSAVTTGAIPTGPGSAVIDGRVDPAGRTTTYDVAYGPESSAWCQDATGTPPSSAPLAPVTLGATDGAFHDVTVDLTGLAQDIPYCAEIVASAGGVASGASPGGELVVTPTDAATGGPPPAVSAGAATTVGPTAEAVGGSVDPDGTDTSDRFEYAPADAAWCASAGRVGIQAATADQDAGAGAAPSPVTATITGLTPATAYCWRLSATSLSGTSTTPQGTFTTPPAPPAPPAPGAPGQTLGVATAGSTARTPAPIGPRCTVAVVSDEVTLRAPPRRRRRSAAIPPGALRVRIRCDQTVSGTLTSTVTAQITRRRARRLRLRAARVRIVAGRAATVTVSLTAPALRDLRARDRETVTFSVRARDAAGSATATVRSGRLRARFEVA
jgi:hypothetical protein